MVDSTASSGKNAKGWTPEENMHLVLTILSSENPELTVKGWNQILTRYQKMYPDKTLPACKQQFAKLRAPYIADFGSNHAKTEEICTKNDPKSVKHKISRKHAAPAGDESDNEDCDQTTTAKPYKRAPKKAKLQMEAAKNNNDNAIENDNGDE